MVECKEVIRQLKRQQHTTWRIVLRSLSPQSLLTILTDINECQVDILDIWNTPFECQVRELVIYDTPFDSNCVSQLSQVLTYNQTMEELYLNSSPLVQDTYHLLTTAVVGNKIIKRLGLWQDNNITDKDIPHFSNLIINNKTLKVLYLNGCPNITKFGKQQLQNVCVNNNSLRVWFNLEILH